VKDPLIAIVDDDEDLCSALVDLMRSIGYRAEPFFASETLLTSPSLPLFDCVIADVRMPGMSGLDLARKFQDQGDLRPVILITALPDGRLEAEAISAGAQRLLRKPVETQILIECVERSLSNERSPR
jgi:FixJ family two-component response regulator